MSGKRVVLARIGAAHGIRGEVRLQLFAADPAAYGALEAADGRVFTIAGLRRQGDTTIARFAGVSDRNAAEALTGTELGVPRERLPEPEADEHYHSDLIGLRAETVAGEALGTVVDIPNYGAGDLIEIAPRRGPTLLVPFTRAAVPVIDVAGGRVVIDPPPGLLDTAEPPPATDGPTGVSSKGVGKRPGKPATKPPAQ